MFAAIMLHAQDTATFHTSIELAIKAHDHMLRPDLTMQIYLVQALQPGIGRMYTAITRRSRCLPGVWLYGYGFESQVGSKSEDEGDYHDKTFHAVLYDEQDGVGSLCASYRIHIMLAFATR